MNRTKPPINPPAPSRKTPLNRTPLPALKGAKSPAPIRKVGKSPTPVQKPNVITKADTNKKSVEFVAPKKSTNVDKPSKNEAPPKSSKKETKTESTSKNEAAKSDEKPTDGEPSDDQHERRPKKKQIRRLRKPKRMRRSERLAKERERKEKEALASNPALERERARLQRQELNAIEKRWMAKKEADFNKRLNELTKDNTELKELEEKLAKENELVKNDRNYKDLELEKLTQFWVITRAQLEEQRRQAVELETRMQRVKTAHTEQISLLHKRISMLQLNTRLEQIGSTQTDPFGDDSECTGHASVNLQTESDWDRQKVNDILKQHDDELAEFIAEIENAKIQAQSDYKFAVVQMEQGLREEHEEELRAVKEEKERQLEEMVRIQCEQLQQIENDKMHMKAELSGEITSQKVEIQELNQAMAQKEDECNGLFDRLQASEKQYDGLSEKYRALNVSYEKNKINGQLLKKDAKTIGDLRNRLEKIEEINEILLGEYKKLEHERNMCAEQLAYLMKAGLVQGGTPGSVQKSPTAQIAVQNKAYEIGEQLDEIRRKYRLA